MTCVACFYFLAVAFGVVPMTAGPFGSLGQCEEIRAWYVEASDSIGSACYTTERSPDPTLLPVGVRYRGAEVVDRAGRRVFIAQPSGRPVIIGLGTVGTLCSMSESAPR
mgnify:CR=1 FL=1